MIISSVGQYSYNVFSNANLSTSKTSDTTATEQVKPKGPPPPPKGGRGQGPKVDTNNDNNWDIEELTALSESLSESGETSFNAEEVLSSYDANGNNIIDESERSAIEENNAFNISGMQHNMMMKSKGQQMGPMSGANNKQNGSIDSIINTLVDESSDNLWGIEELKSFSELLESAGGSTFEADDIIEKYDLDNDGYISVEERDAIKANDEFSLSEESFKQQFVIRGLKAYEMQSNYQAYVLSHESSSLLARA